ncbi:MAG TPA: hypothetical protein VKE70_35560 [Candidatus Solibacter sp.]|nr:hypothetical protein [Candidatus Solibacter sp.]
MATLPAFLKRNDTPVAAPVQENVSRTARVRVERDPFQLRALPHDDVYFYCKRIDNSRLVREDDPKSRGACWSAIGAACLMLALLTGAFAPTAMTTLAGYKLEALHGEERRLLEEGRNLDLQEAELLSPANLDQWARDKNLVAPAAGQVVHLDKPEGEVAMVK